MSALPQLLFITIIAVIIGFLFAIKLGFLGLSKYRAHFVILMITYCVFKSLVISIPLLLPYLHLQIELVRQISLGYYFLGAEVLFVTFLIFIKPLFSDLSYKKALKNAVGRYFDKQDKYFFLNQEDIENYYQRHVRWRFEVFFRRMSRWFEEPQFRNIPNIRVAVVIITACVVIWGAVTIFMQSEANWWKWLIKPENLNKGSSTLLLAVIGAPFAFLIWWFRDINARQQIENQRKDVNLKDFQRLAEWVSGLHLPEDNITESTKQIKESGTEKSENILSREYNQPPKYSLLTASRRDGATSLQIAAIYQLGAFLNGEYGKYFQRPAFQLLKSVWLSLVARHDEAFKRLMESAKNNYSNLLLVSDENSPTIDFLAINQINTSNLENELQKFQFECQAWSNALNEITTAPIARAIINTMGSHYGKNFRTQLDDLPEAMLLGYRSILPSIYAPLELDSLNCVDLRGINFRGADLHGALFHNSDLGWAQFECANLSKARFQCAQFYATNFVGASLSQANFDGAQINNSYFNGCSLTNASFQDCLIANCNMVRISSTNATFKEATLGCVVLLKAQLEQVDFDSGMLKHVKFNAANLKNANFSSSKIGVGTSFNQADLSSAILTCAMVELADFSGATLEQANLENTMFINITIDDATKFDSAKTNDGTIILIAKNRDWDDEGYFEKIPTLDEIDEKATLKFRGKLKKNGLILPDRLYKEIF